MLTIRPATPADVPTLIQFIRELADYEKLLHECHANAPDLHIHLFGPTPYAQAILACIDGAPVGFALFFHNYSTFRTRPGIYLEDLYVQPHHRGSGIGKALLKHLAKIALSQNCARLEWSVLNWNTPSIAFYESLGATPQSDWTTFRLTRQPLQDLAATP